MGELLKCFANGRRHFADQVTPRGMFIIVWDRGSASSGGAINAVRIVIGARGCSELHGPSFPVCTPT